MQKSNHTEVPNDFFDKWMPKLKGSEIQVFLTICRQTRGWHKETDRISISQLQNKTGLSNRSVIDASKSLEEKGLIITEIVDGIKCYEIAYEKSSQVKKEGVKKVHRGCEENSQFAYEKSSHTKETITKETKQNKIYPFQNFWDDYGKKRERSKCEQKWKSVSDKDKELIKDFIPIYKSHVESIDYLQMKYPYTFLNSEIWKDDWDEYKSETESTEIDMRMYY